MGGDLIWHGYSSDDKLRNTDPEALRGVVQHRLLRHGPPNSLGKRVRWEVSRSVLEQPWREGEKERAFIWPFENGMWEYRIREVDDA